VHEEDSWEDFALCVVNHELFFVWRAQLRKEDHHADAARRFIAPRSALRILALLLQVFPRVTLGGMMR
jgi:hypothetical protein